MIFSTVHSEYDIDDYSGLQCDASINYSVKVHAIVQCTPPSMDKKAREYCNHTLW